MDRFSFQAKSLKKSSGGVGGDNGKLLSEWLNDTPTLEAELSEQ